MAKDGIQKRLNTYLMFDRENFDDYDAIITNNELSQLVDEEYNAMSDEEKHLRLVQCDPTFLQHCLSLASNKANGNPDAKFIINEYTYKFELVE